MWVTPSYPIVKFSHIERFCPLGAPQSLKTTKTCLRSTDNPLPTFRVKNTRFPIVKSSHCKIYHLEFPWHTRSSTGNNWVPSGGLGMAPRAWKWPKYVSNHSIVLCPPSMWVTVSFSPKCNYYIVKYLVSTFHGTQFSILGTLGALEGLCRA